MSNLLIETRLFEGRVNEDESGRTIVKGILQRARKQKIRMVGYIQNQS